MKTSSLVINSLPNVKKLTDITTPYKNFSDTDKLFIEAMKEISTWHMEKCAFYSKLAIAESFSPNDLSTIKDLVKIPHIFAHFFKEHEILSIDREDIFLHLTSSGTTGQKSQVFFDEWSIKSAQRMVDYIFSEYGWDQSRSACNYVLFSYQTEAESKLGTSFTDNFLCKYAPVNEVFTTLRLTDEGKHEFDCFGTIEALKRFETQGLPVRLFGFPAFLYFTLERMKSLGIKPLKLHSDSLVFLGGGWKGHADKEIKKEKLYGLAHEMLGINHERLRDGFGSVEHCVPYIECSHHEFHVPIWSRVFIRDVHSLSILPLEEVGFIQFVSPYITSMPAHSVIMGDLGSLHQNCKCGLETPYFKIHGRAGVSKNKSCALQAADLLKDRGV